MQQLSVFGNHCHSNKNMYHSSLIFTQDGNTPLHTACKSGNADVVRILLENDPEHRAINSPNKVSNLQLIVYANK